MLRRRLLASILPAALALSTGLANAAPVSEPRVAIETTMGTIVVQLSPDRAPITVKNFLRYVNEGHYTDTIFHRVIAGFMIHGSAIDRCRSIPGRSADAEERQTEKAGEH